MSAGPYIVSYRHLPEHEGATGWERRWAYATLEEARFAALRRLADFVQAGGLGTDSPSSLIEAINTLPESGGTIKLPDGSEIVAEATTRSKLMAPLLDSGRMALAKQQFPWDDAAVCAAWNAEYGIPSGEPCDHCEGSGRVWGVDEDGNADDPDCESSCGRCGGTGTRR
jgi:hypothetical protein